MTISVLMEGLITIALLPLWILNLLGSIVSGIWLLVIGDWRSVVFGFGLFLIVNFLLSILLIPGMFIAAPAVKLLEKNKKISAYFFMVLSQMWTLGVFSLWGWYIFSRLQQGASYSNFFPLAIWSYGLATGPMAAMASKERDNEFTSLSTVFFQIVYLALIITWLFSPNSSELSSIPFLLGFVLLTTTVSTVVIAKFKH